MAGLRRKAAILTHPHRSFLRRHLEHHLVDLQAQVIDSLADQIAVSVADMLELFGGNSYMQCASADVGESRRLQPCLKALAVDLFFERTQNPNPLVQNGCRDWNK